MVYTLIRLYIYNYRYVVMWVYQTVKKCAIYYYYICIYGCDVRLCVNKRSVGGGGGVGGYYFLKWCELAQNRIE